MKRLVIIMVASMLVRSCTDVHETGVGDSVTLGCADGRIRAGSSWPSGRVGHLTTQSIHGAMAYVSHVNDNWGTHGHAIKIQW